MSKLVPLVCLLLLGCDQFARIGVEATPLSDSGSPPDGPPMNQLDAMVVLDARAMEPDAMATDASMDAESDAGAACPEPQYDICDPVTNEFFDETVCGPAFMQQCAIEQLSVLQGYCIFTSQMPSTLGGACFNSGVTESCPPTTTCSTEGICRKICLCDADCAASECCTEPVGETGFKLCGPC